MAPKKQTNRKTLTLAQALEKLGRDNSKWDMPGNNVTMYRPYNPTPLDFPDPLSPDRRENTYKKKGFLAPGPGMIYDEKFPSTIDIPNLNPIETRMPMYDGVSKKEKNRKKLAEALSRHIGKILPF